jgi:hypothetical protein
MTHDGNGRNRFFSELRRFTCLNRTNDFYCRSIILMKAKLNRFLGHEENVQIPS